jgi:hypothetical protein
MAANELTCFTFTLGSGRRVTFAGINVDHARDKVMLYHPGREIAPDGERTPMCRCPGPAYYGLREGGWKICAECSGRISG